MKNVSGATTKRYISLYARPEIHKAIQSGDAQQEADTMRAPFPFEAVKGANEDRTVSISAQVLRRAIETYATIEPHAIEGLGPILIRNEGVRLLPIDYSRTIHLGVIAAGSKNQEDFAVFADAIMNEQRDYAKPYDACASNPFTETPAADMAHRPAPGWSFAQHVRLEDLAAAPAAWIDRARRAPLIVTLAHGESPQQKRRPVCILIGIEAFARLEDSREAHSSVPKNLISDQDLLKALLGATGQGRR